MNRPYKFLLTALVAFLLTSVTTQSQAMRFWRFRITRDGQPAFTGGIGMGDSTPPADVLKMGLHRAKIQLGRDSVINAGDIGDGDVTLDGNVVFRFPDLPPLELKRLRLIHVPQSREGVHVAGGYYDWMLHRDDADAIIRHYTADASPATDRVTNLPLVLATVLVAVVVGLMLTRVAIRRKTRAEAS